MPLSPDAAPASCMMTKGAVATACRLAGAFGAVVSITAAADDVTDGARVDVARSP